MPPVLEPPPAPATIPATTAPPPPAKPATAAPVAPAKAPEKPTAEKPPDKPVSAKERMRKEAYEKWGGEKPVEAPAKPESKDPSLETESKAPSLENKQPAAEPEKPGKEKFSPFKIIEQYKERTLKLESELAEAKSRIIPEADAKALQDRLTATEERAKKAEEELYFANYQQHPDFKTKYQEPYEAAWKRAMSELSQLSVADGEGNKRPASAQDLLELVNLPLDKAREISDAAFGPFSNDVMGFRKELRSLFDQQSAALEDAKKNGVERTKQMREKLTKFQTEVTTQIKKNWDQVNESILADPEFGGYFKPREGDDEGNKLLEKGYALADRGFNENPLNPNLKPEERAAIVKRHAAIRNRAAAFGRLRRDVKQRDARIAELENELKAYKDTEPGNGSGRGAAPPTTLTAREAMHQELAKISKPIS